MTHQALGLFEFAHVTHGIRAMDAVLKTANVEVLRGFVVNPGKYVLIVTGNYGAVHAAMTHLHASSIQVLDFHMLGNPSAAVIRALRESAEPAQASLEQRKGWALGMVETSTIISAIRAADVIDKSIHASRLELRMSAEYGGKGMVVFQAEIAAVQAGVEAAMDITMLAGTFIEQAILANPTPDVVAQFFGDFK